MTSFVSPVSIHWNPVCGNGMLNYSRIPMHYFTMPMNQTTYILHGNHLTSSFLAGCGCGRPLVSWKNVPMLYLLNARWRGSYQDINDEKRNCGTCIFYVNALDWHLGHRIHACRCWTSFCYFMSDLIGYRKGWSKGSKT